MKPKTKHQKRMSRKEARRKRNKQNPKPKVNHRRTYTDKEGKQIIERINYPYGRRDGTKRYTKIRVN
jgi:hypothetical protein